MSMVDMFKCLGNVQDNCDRATRRFVLMKTASDMFNKGQKCRGSGATTMEAMLEVGKREGLLE